MEKLSSSLVIGLAVASLYTGLSIAQAANKSEIAQREKGLDHGIDHPQSLVSSEKSAEVYGITKFLRNQALVEIAAGGRHDDQGREKTFMSTKLMHAQKVLEGLLTEDFHVIVKHSQQMSLLSRAVAWQILEGTEYDQRSAEFRRSVDALTEAAKQKNLDAVSLSYIDMTIKCVACHKYVRKVRHTQRK